jgi:hypothetical protein
MNREKSRQREPAGFAVFPRVERNPWRLADALPAALQWNHAAPAKDQMRASGVHRVIISCADYRCSHSTTAIADGWPDDARLSDIEDRFVCKACGRRGADVRPLFAGT